MKNEKVRLKNQKGHNQVRLSFREAFMRAAKQIELNTAPRKDLPKYKELCGIIAEVYLINDNSKIKIDNEFYDAIIVKEVFLELKQQHLQLVLENFEKITYYIKFKKAYLRTALYNSVFELNSYYINISASEE